MKLCKHILLTCMFSILYVLRAKELCEGGGGHPGLSIPNNPYGLCGCKTTLEEIDVLTVGKCVPLKRLSFYLTLGCRKYIFSGSQMTPVFLSRLLTVRHSTVLCNDIKLFSAQTNCTTWHGL